MLANILSLFATRSDFFAKLLGQHLRIASTAILLAGSAGLFLGIFISSYKNVAKIVLSVVNFLYTIPAISLLGLLLPFLGIGNKTAIAALSVYALLPMVRNTYTGISEVNENIIEAARGMGCTEFQLLVKIKLPLAFPVIMAGIRSMVTMTIAVAGIASFIGAGGLGVAIYRGITTNNSALTWAGSLMIAALAISLDIILGVIEKLYTRNGRKK